MAMRNLKQLVTKICSVSAISCMSRECIAGPKCLQLKQKRSKKRVRYQKAVAKCTNSKGVAMVKYHCDAIPEKGVTNNNLGGNLSVCFPTGQKPLVIFGHDECIFKQYTMTGKQWYGPNGETYVIPKDDGAGVMISAFQS